MKKVCICVLLVLSMNFISCTPTQMAQSATEQASGGEDGSSINDPD